MLVKTRYFHRIDTSAPVLGGFFLYQEGIPLEGVSVLGLGFGNSGEAPPGGGQRDRAPRLLGIFREMAKLP